VGSHSDIELRNLSLALGSPAKALDEEQARKNRAVGSKKDVIDDQSGTPA
jgi:hypothetical protein